MGVVNQQSEHLSNAQIENYGDRSSGEGPEQDQRDEEQWVEAHLADCSSCRGRVLDFHRTHLFRDSELAGPGAGVRMEPDLKPGNPNPRDPRLSADAQANTASTPDCPSKDDIRLLAAGLCSDAIATQLAQHAATCDHCGALLRNFIEDFSDDFSPEEQAMLDRLASNSEAWQIKTAREMARSGAVGAVGAAGTAAAADDIHPAEARLPANPSPAKPGPKPSFWRWVPVPATAACALVVFSVWYYVVRDTPEKVGRYLIQASSEQRTIQMRWPGADWRQYEGKRRGVDGKEPSLALLEAEHVIAGQSEKSLRDAAWIRVAAEAKIIAGEPQKAIPALEREWRSNPASVPLALDLATAYFGLADLESYEKSRALLDSVLKQEPNNTVARFNRALVFERLHDAQKADDDWKIFLDTEKDPGWLAEAQKHREELRQLK